MTAARLVVPSLERILAWVRASRTGLYRACAFSLPLCLAGSFQCIASDDDWNAETLMKELSQITHVKLDFAETRSSAFLFIDLVVEGNMEYRAPDYLLKNTVEPVTERVLISGDEMLVEQVLKEGKGEETTLVRRYSVQSHVLLQATVESIRALLAGNFGMLVENFEMDLSGARDHWQLSLVPRSETILESVVKITLSGESTRVNEIVTIHADGDETILHLTYRLLQSS